MKAIFTLDNWAEIYILFKFCYTELHYHNGFGSEGFIFVSCY